MPNRLRVGILGVGRRWRRYGRALSELRGLLEPVAVYDPRPGRALRVARQLHCPIDEGPVALLERDEVEALLVLDAPWFGLWPIEQACRVGKPVFCAASLSRDDLHAEGLVEQVRTARLPVLMAHAEAVAPAQVRLGRLLAAELGPARILRVDRCLPVPPGRPRSVARLLEAGPVLGLLIGIDALFGGPPRTVWAGGAGTDLVSMLLDYDGGRCAQVTLWAGGPRGPRGRLEVVAAGGTATVESPARLAWRDAHSSHAQRRPVVDPTRTLLERFARDLSDGRPLWPGLDDAYRALGVLRAARRSLAEHQAVGMIPGFDTPGVATCGVDAPGVGTPGY